MTALRVPVSLGSGGLVIIALFWLLWTFVNAPLNIGAVLQPTVIKFTRQIVETPIETKRREPVKREPPPRVINGPTVGPTDTGIGAVTPFTPTDFTGGRLEQRTLTPGQDRDAIPLIRIDPDYPPSALARNIEGWVQVQFAITATGAVRDPFVVGAQPLNIFDAAALNAVARWRYQPKIEGGVPVERVGVQTVIRFALEQ